MLRPRAPLPLHTVFLPSARQSSSREGAGHCSSPGKDSGNIAENAYRDQRGHTSRRVDIRQQGFQGTRGQRGDWKQSVGSGDSLCIHSQPSLQPRPHSRASPIPTQTQTPPSKPKALPFKGPKKVPLYHPYSASVSLSAKWAHTSTWLIGCCLKATLS